MYVIKDFATRANHVGRDETYRPNDHQIPYFRSVTGEFDDVKDFESKMQEGKIGVYARLPHNNYNHDSLEKRLTDLDGGVETLVYSSGMAAIAVSLLACTLPGQEILASDTLYGCSYELLKYDMPLFFGRKVRFAKIKNKEDAQKNLSKDTAVIFIEPIKNPTLDVTDLRGFHRHNLSGAIVVADNTFATPYNLRPLDFGVDIVAHSLTKYLNGMGDVLMGSTTVSKEFAQTIYNRNLLRLYKNLGPTPSPHDSSLVTRSICDFPSRMETHNLNSYQLAQTLCEHPKVKMVYYPGLATGPDWEVVRSTMRTPSGDYGFGGMLSFELHEESKTEDFLNILAKETFIKLAVSLGSAQTIVCRPAKTTHSFLTKEEKIEMGVPEELIRVSVGRENYNDIEGAFHYALDKI